MNKLENEHQGYNARIRSAEVAVTTVKSTAQDIKRLERSLSAIDESDRHRSAWIESAEPRLAKLQEDIDKGKKVQPRVSALEGKYEDLEGEVQRLTSNQELAMGKIATLESNLQDSGAQKLIKKNDMNDVRALGQRLQALEALRKEERATARAMHDKIGSLEGDLQKYDSRNEQLRVRLETSLLTRGT
jgi:chromosome segregation ATPase